MVKEDVVHIYKGMLVIKRNEIVPFAETCRDLPTITPSKVCHKEKNKYHIILLVCGI